MQARGWLIQNVKDAVVFRARQMRCKFQALGFTTRKRGGGLTEAEIAEADFVQDASFAVTLGTLTKKARASRTVTSRTSWTFFP